LQTLASLLGRRPYILVTSAGWSARGMIERIMSACGEARAVFDSIPVNPTLEDLASLDPALTSLRVKDMAVVALGGGSVMDAAKAIVVALASGEGMAVVDRCVRANALLPDGLAMLPLFCIPTTAGTGSEVTKTATLWDGATRAKYSLCDPRLFPKAAILDPLLTVSCPRELTLSTGLDALSHAMESIWNVNRTPISDALAVSAIARLKRYLPTVLTSPGDLHARAELQTAALLSGLAIGTTRTALAHSISYPLTGRFGLQHGLACGFTLPDVAAYNLAANSECVRLIAEAFGVRSAEELPYALREWMRSLGVYEAVRHVLHPQAIAALGVSVITPGRADNNIRPATVADAHAILYSALDDKAWSRAEQAPAHGRVIWITGLSGTGKTTLSRAVASAMRAGGRQPVLLDGDELRAPITGKVGYSEAERRKLAFQYASICQFLSLQGMDVVCATMALFHASQEWNRKNIPGYIEVYLKMNFQKLVARDPKSLYNRALRGEVSNVAGVDLPYEEPLAPDLVIDNDMDRDDMGQLVERVLALLK